MLKSKIDILSISFQDHFEAFYMFVFNTKFVSRGFWYVEFIFDVCCEFWATAYAHFEHKQDSAWNFENEYQEWRTSINFFCKHFTWISYGPKCMCTNFCDLSLPNGKVQFSWFLMEKLKLNFFAPAP